MKKKKFNIGTSKLHSAVPLILKILNIVRTIEILRHRCRWEQVHRSRWGLDFMPPPDIPANLIPVFIENTPSV
jgi:hypothetical protein